MPSARSSITIARPVSDVFAYSADTSNARAWRPAVLDVELASGDGLAAVYRQGVKGPGGRRIAADITVTAFEPNRRLGRAVQSTMEAEGANLARLKQVLES